MVKKPEISASRPKIMKKNPPPLAAKVGSTGSPTTFFSVCPAPGHCVCLWMTTNIRWTPMAAMSSAGTIMMWSE